MKQGTPSQANRGPKNPGRSAAPISGAGRECFCLTRGYWATNSPNKTMLWVLPSPIPRHSCQLLLIATFLACCLAAER